MLKNLKEIIINKASFLPIFEGGKGIGISNGVSAGHFAANGAIGTFSGVNPDIISPHGEITKLIIKAKTRLERNKELIEKSIKGIISQAKIARDIAGTKGRIHMNVMWEMTGTEHILEEALSKTKGLIQGIVCGAGLPYKLGDICAKYKTLYFPIVSSVRAFRILWKKSYARTKEWLGGVVYECPWRAGGHNGLSNNEDPFVKGDTYSRVAELRKFMDEVDLKDIPIIIAGGVWNLKDYEKFLDNKEIGNVAFQFGTRPIVTVENPAPMPFKQALLNVKKNDIKTNNFSPTGFWSSAVNNTFLQDLYDRSIRQIGFSKTKTEEFSLEFSTNIFINPIDLDQIEIWKNEGFNKYVRTPDDTLLFLKQEKLEELKKDMADCCGCLSQCQFSCWCQNSQSHTTGKIPDFRKMCIQKALQNAKNGDPYPLYFSGSEAYRFGTDPMYKNGYIPTTKELIEALIDGR